MVTNPILPDEKASMLSSLLAVLRKEMRSLMQDIALWPPVYVVLKNINRHVIYNQDIPERRFTRWMYATYDQ